MSVGKRIQSLREDNGYSKAAFGALFGVLPQTVTNWESDIFAPNRDRLTKMSELFAVSVNWILNGIDLPENGRKPAAEAKSGTIKTDAAAEIDPQSYAYIVRCFEQLSPRRKNRLIGYLSALSDALIGHEEKDKKEK